MVYYAFKVIILDAASDDAIKQLNELTAQGYDYCGTYLDDRIILSRFINSKKE
jgi:hypothetical protein